MSAQEGDKAYAEAEKKLKGSMLGFGKDPDAAVDCFKRACNNYKVAGRYSEAARCQERVAEVASKQSEFYDEASARMEAAKLHVKDKNMKAAIDALKQARNLYVQHGKLSQAARACRELASAVKDNGDRESQELALNSYMEAARMYETDSQYSDMYKMKLEAATIKVLMQRYLEASQLFESVANEYVNNNLLKYSARDLYMNALLCIMAEGDTTTAMVKKDEYILADVQFEGSRQENLITNCLNAMLGSNEEDFATAVAEWESMIKLDAFRVKLLLEAKGTISSGGQDIIEDSDGLDLT